MGNRFLTNDLCLIVGVQVHGSVSTNAQCVGNGNRGRPGGGTKSLPLPRGTPSSVFSIVLYSASGNAWPNPQLITISFMPDGTNLGGGVKSNLFSTFNSKSSLAGNWENVILQAAQSWAQETNINFAVVPDDGAASGSGPDEQGSVPASATSGSAATISARPRLLLTYQPPPVNNFSIAGDIAFNTGQSFNVGSTYDLFHRGDASVGPRARIEREQRHEQVIEYPTYSGKKTALAKERRHRGHPQHLQLPMRSRARPTRV